MFFLYLAIPALIFGVIFFALAAWRESKCNAGEFSGLCLVVCVFVCAASLFLMTIQTCFAYSWQLQRFENVKENQAVTKIYQNKAENLTAQFSEYLVKQYPQYEKEIFKSISPSDVEVYLVQYPEIRSSETILALVGQIRQLQDDIYNQQIKLEAIIRAIRFAPQNPWVLRRFVPKASPEILNLSLSVVK